MAWIVICKKLQYQLKHKSNSMMKNSCRLKTFNSAESVVLTYSCTDNPVNLLLGPVIDNVATVECN